jgi:sugar phosphate isomerase/epimerase
MSQDARSNNLFSPSAAWSRRKVLKAGAVAAGVIAGGLGRVAVAGPPGGQEADAKKPFSLRHVLASSMYEKGIEIERILPEVRKTGMEALDVWAQNWVPHRDQIEKMGHDKFLKLLEENRARLASVSCYRLGPFGLKDELPVIKKLGGDLAIAGSAGGGKDVKEAVKAFVDKLQPTVELGEKLGVTIGIENHGGSLLSSPDSIRYFAEFAKSPRLGLVFAPYHLPQDPKVLGDLIREVGRKIAHIYLWQKASAPKGAKAEPIHQLPGFGTLDFVPVIAALKAANYTGWSEVFMHGKVAGTLEEITAVVTRSRKHIDECVAKV